MMSLWENNKQNIVIFWKVKNKSIMMLLCGILAINLAAYYFIPFAVTDAVQQNYYFTPWYLSGLSLKIFGIFLMIHSLFTFGEKKSMKVRLKILMKIILIFAGVSLAIAVVIGMSAVYLTYHQSDILQTAIIIERIAVVAVAPLKAFVLLLFIKLLYDLPWKSIGNHIAVTTVLFYGVVIGTLLIQRIGSSAFALAIQAILTACLSTLLMVSVLFFSHKKFL